MKKLLILFLLLGLSAYGEEFKLSFFIGDVFVKQKDKKEYVRASINMILKEGEIIKTGEDSSCEIKRNGDVIKIEANSTFILKVLKEKKDIFSVLFGKVFFMIKKLKHKDVSIETPTSVMGLRGTIFSVDVFGKRTIVDLLDGELDIFVENKEFLLRAGERFFYDCALPFEERIKKRPLSQDEKDKLRDIFQLPQAQLPKTTLSSVALLPQVKNGLFEGFEAIEEDKNLKIEIESIRNDLVRERLSVLSVKENDFQAGRTMRDLDGRLVRVEQHLYRPTNREIRFVNINKRDEEFSYGMISATFNKDLPDDISKWPEWIKDQFDEEKTEFHPERLETILSNGRPQDKNADRMKWESEWDYKKNKLKEMTFSIDKGGDNKLDYKEYSNDWKETGEITGKDKDEFWVEKTFSIDGNELNNLKLGLYLIDNDGKKITSSFFKDRNFFDCLDNIGLETRFKSDTLLSKPINIIFITDIILAGIRRLVGD